MNRTLKKALLLLLALALLAGTSLVQRSLNTARDKLGLTRVPPLENAPPVLAFTTVALGGFRGLISNALWIRANELQMNDKFFEMVQLADWITKLEPHFVQVWLVQAWNMAYNISVKFKDEEDRWRWVQQGIRLLRDDGLRFNPNEPLIYRELAWFFQHKMGHNLDDAHAHYKNQWARQMSALLGATNRPNFDLLITPQTDEEKARARRLREEYKLDPAFMKELDERYGPLEWRLPESHAIYWAALGLRQAERNPTRVEEEDLITLRRVIYQSVQLACRRGRLVPSPFTNTFTTAPDLDLVPKASAAYEQQIQEEKEIKDSIARAHRNFLKDAIYFLYTYNRANEARKWFNYLAEKYPNDTMLFGDTNSFPRNLTLDEFVFARVQETVGETDQDRVRVVLESLITRSFMSLLVDEDDHAAGMMLLAATVHARYQQAAKDSGDRISLPSLDELRQQVLNDLLNPQSGLLPELAARLRTELGLPAPPPSPGTNAPAPAAPL